MTSAELWAAWRESFRSNAEAHVTAIWIANRLVKNHYRSTRRVFYECKDSFIRTHQHCLIEGKRVRVEQRFCRACGGTGDDGNCFRCDGTGIWSERTLYCHYFIIAGRRYSFHSYEKPARVSIEPGEDLESYGGRFTEEEMKEFPLPMSGLLRMLRWVTAAGVPAEPVEEIRFRIPCEQLALPGWPMHSL